MGKTLKSGILILLFLCCNALSMSAQNPLAYLRQVYPRLTNLYQEELSRYPAHYIFAVDVSGTMNKYQNDVTSSLAQFYGALPDNDRVDVIPFGTDAMVNMMSYCGIIDSNVRGALMNNINNLYTNGTYPPGMKAHTDIKKAVDAIARVIQNNRDYKVNVIIILTDFRNDVLGSNPPARKFTDQELDDMATEIGAATNKIYTRSIALELPVDPRAPEYCLPLLKDKVFPELEIVPLNNPGAMIGQWFNQLKRDIMVTKLKAIIDDANRTNPVRLTTDIDYDGNVYAKIHWTPNKLYPKIQIDSTCLSQKGFTFKNNKDAYTQTMDSVIGEDPELYLGQIKNEKYGFHHLQDSLHLGLLLPTEYDEELTGLGIKKPLPNTTQYVDKWVFTFFLPLWLTCLIVFLIILYIWGVLNAVKRNNSLKLDGKATLFVDGEAVDRPVEFHLTPSEDLNIGKIGRGKLKVDDAEWNLKIYKKKANPFLIFAKPYFVWGSSAGYVAQNKTTSDKLTPPDEIKVKCGKNRNDITHSVKVTLINNKI